MSLRFKRHHGLLVLMALVPALLILGSVLWACTGGLGFQAPTSEPVEAVQATEVTEAPTAAQPATEPVNEPTAESVNKPPENVPGSGEATAAAEELARDIAGATQITLDTDRVAVDGVGVVVTGSQVTIISAGTYSLRGTLRDGQIVVDTQDKVPVTLVLNGVDIHSSTSAPICVMNAEETAIILAEGTENYLSDADSYLLAEGEDEPNATLYSKDDLTISGNGSLEVDGNYNDGIASKDGLTITGGTITTHSVDDGIRGKDYLVIRDGNVTVTAQGDGFKSDEEEDDTKGYILIEGGVVNITAGGDAIQAQTDATITGGELSLSSGGGSRNRIDESTSAKGIKGVASVRIDGGALTVDSADDAVHSNGSIAVNGGTLVLASGDDGMHADATLEINDGEITITESYEGLESAVITVNDGEIGIVSSDDGINVSGGNDRSGMNPGPGFGGGGRGGIPGGGPGQDGFASGDQYLYIHGGYITIDAGGDGLDVNGSTEMTGGTVIVNGPTERMNGALDSGRFSISGGFLVAAGSAGMAQSPDESSTQYSVLINFGATIRAGTLIHIRSSEGEEVLTFAPTKQYETVVLSSPALKRTTYDVSLGGTATGPARDGLYEGGTVADTTDIGSFTISGIVTWVGGGYRR
jgi:hypothetical protein